MYYRYEQVGRTLLSAHQLVLFFDPPLVRSLAFSVDHLGMVPVGDVVERDGVVCDC